MCRAACCASRKLAADVDVERQVEVVDGELEERLRDGDARVVDEHVEPAETRRRRR